MTLNPVKWLHGKTHKKGDRGLMRGWGWPGRREAESQHETISWGAGGRGGASPRSSLPSNPRASVLLFPTGPSSQRQVQNGPSPDEMDIQRR